MTLNVERAGEACPTGADSRAWHGNHGQAGVFCRNRLPVWNNGLCFRRSRRPLRNLASSPASLHRRVNKPSCKCVISDSGRPIRATGCLHAGYPRPRRRTPGHHRHRRGLEAIQKDGYGSRIADAFVQDGYAVVAPNYVLSAPGNPTWPVNFEDVQAAVRWVRSNAGTLGINPNEIVAMGESAGANLAALLGTYSTQSSWRRGFRGRRCRRRDFDADRSDDPLR